MVTTAQNPNVKPGYKQSELGLIPEDWEVKLLGEIAIISSGGTPDRLNPTYWGYDIAWVTTTQIDFNLIDEANEFITKKGLENSATRVYNPGTLLMAMYGQGKTRGKVAELAINAAINQACAAIKLDRGISSKYTFFNLSYRYEKIRGLSNNGNQENLNSTIIKHILLPMPKKEKEQRAIATTLSDVDALIASLDQLIAKLRDIKHATMQQLLTGKTRLPGFSNSGSAKLGDFFELNPSKIHLSDTDLVTFIRMEDVSENGHVLNEHIVPSSSIKKGFTFFERGDVLVAKITPCFENGKGACLDTMKTRAGFGSTEFHVLRANRNGVPRYIFYQTQNDEFREKLESEMIGSAGQKRVPAQAIVNHPLPVLHFIKEQQAIASILSDMDAEIVALEQRRDKTRALKQGMMQELLTGKTRLV